MIYKLFEIPFSLGWVFTSILVAFLLTLLAIKLGMPLLPKDVGRAFAFEGERTRGKARGSGLIFCIVAVSVFLLFVPLTLEYVIYYVLFLLAMLFGFLDDKSKISWRELKKGLLDLALCMVAAGVFMIFNDSYQIACFGFTCTLPWWLFFLIATSLLWVSINFTNCTDGVDGLLGTLASVSFATFAAVFMIAVKDQAMMQINLIMIAAMLAYLAFNTSPSLAIMGDAGSRAIGILFGMMALKSGNLLLYIPAALVIILDGGIGLLKLVVIRITKKKAFLQSIRTPLHDHARYKWKWSDAQVVNRFATIQMIASGILIALAILNG